MTIHLDPSKSIKENVLILINEANASDITLADVDINNIQPVEGAIEGARNTSAYVEPLPAGRFNVSAGGVTVNYRRLAFEEQIQQQVEIKAERTTTIEEIHAQICEKYGLFNDGVSADGLLPGLGEILPGETFEVTITPKDDGNLVYLPKPIKITITWDGVWINQVLAITDLSGFKNTAIPDEFVVRLSADDLAFTSSKLDTLVSQALQDDWNNPLPIRIIVETGIRIVSVPNDGTNTTPVFDFTAKYGNRPYVLLENHGDIIGGGGAGGANWYNSGAGKPGRDAIRVDASLATILQIDNQGRIGGGGGGGGGGYSETGCGGAPFGNGGRKATYEKGGSPETKPGYLDSGMPGGDIGMQGVGNWKYGPAGPAGYAVRGKAVYLNKGVILGTTS